jgi:phospholipase A1/A2
MRSCAAALVALSSLGASAGAMSADDNGNGCRDQFLSKHLKAYDPIYFVVGNDDEVGYNAKFQISVDFEFFCSADLDNEGAAEGSGRSVLSRLSQLHLGFSQTSVWDLSELSSPFRDSSYRPRLFYRLITEKPKSDRWLAELDAGFAHESNGKAGLDSRSINMLFVRPKLSFGLGSGGARELNIQPMIYGYTSLSDNNKDIADYRGYVDLHIEYLWGPLEDGIRKEDPWMVWTDLRKGKRSDFGSVEVNLAIPYRSVPLLDRFKGWLMLQYFDGHGETLIDYNVKDDTQYRLGFAIVL